MAYTIYPTGTTIFNPEKCWSGYTIFQAHMFENKSSIAVLIDMNGNIVNQWRGLDGIPNKMLPGGYVMGNSGSRDQKYGFQDQLDVVQVDWDGNVVWKFNKYQKIRDGRKKPQWMARQHHDFQREGNPVGYYVPGMDPLTDKGNTLILSHKNLINPKISEKLLLDDAMIEVTWDGEIVWEWLCNEHFEEMGFSEDAMNTISRNPGQFASATGGDWTHINSMSRLGPNKWYDAGDERFHPDNIIWDGRQTNIIAIIDKKTGKLVWQIGPEYNTSPELKKLGWIVGQHHAHMIPRGLPGEGNILVYDNGGQAGYGASNPGSPNGVGVARRDHSRVIEFDPITLEMQWSTMPAPSGPGDRPNRLNIYSGHISSAQRLPNGNTLITEGATGHLIEVTPELEVVWDYVSPYYSKNFNANHIYRAYRLPYDWVPQADKPEEIAIEKIDVSKFKVPGTPKLKTKKTTKLQ